MKIIDTDIEVELLHYGFDLVIVQHLDGRQELLKPEQVGLKRRERPRRFKY